MCVKLPDWAIAVLAASVGALLGVICGVLIYKCCFKSCRKKSCSDSNDTSVSGILNVQGSSLIGPSFHRTPPNYFNGFTFGPNFEQSDFDGEVLGVENGIRGDTYF